MAIRREAREVAAIRPAAPLWVRQSRHGLARFDGDLAAWRRARSQWCKDHRCRRPGEPCTHMEALACATSTGTGVVKVVRDGQA